MADEKYKVESPTKEYVLTNPNESLASILSTIYNTTPRIADDYKRPDYTDLINSRIRGVDDLSKTLGVRFTYDRDEIEKIYQDATMAALRMEQNSGAERQYYNNLANAQNTMLDTIRQQYGSAVTAGANRGMQAANMLSAILGTTQTANEEATNLANARQELVNKYAQQMRQDTVDALNYSNDIANTVGSLSHQLYNDEIQQKTAELAYNQGINTDYAGYMASQYTAIANLLSSLASTGAGVYNNNQSAIAALEAAIETARGSKDTAGITKGNKVLEEQNKQEQRLEDAVVSPVIPNTTPVSVVNPSVNPAVNLAVTTPTTTTPTNTDTPVTTTPTTTTSTTTEESAKPDKKTTTTKKSTSASKPVDVNTQIQMAQRQRDILNYIISQRG